VFGSRRRARAATLVTRACVALGAALSLACPSGDDGDDGTELPACADVAFEGCAMLFEPTFDAVFDNTLMPDCATGGGSCHASASAAGAELGGLHFEDREMAYTLLLAADHEPRYVKPGDPACSMLVVRLTLDDPVEQMPPGAPLMSSEQCSIMQWIAMGAMR
jgi:hypothetical protein